MNIKIQIFLISLLLVFCRCEAKETKYYHNTFGCDDETDWNDTQSCDSVELLMGFLEITVLEV